MLEELEQANITLSNHVKRKVEFLSGALLVECKSVKDKEKFKKIVETLDQVYIKPRQRVYPHSVRIQKIPIDTTVDEISDECI